jgi:hypothetical protein
LTCTAERKALASLRLDESNMNNFMTAAEAAQLIQDGDTVGLMGGGGGLMEATHLFEAVQTRFLIRGSPAISPSCTRWALATRRPRA